MKVKAKKILCKITVVFLAVLLSVSMPLSALAEPIPLDTEIVADDNASLVTPTMNENGGYSIGSYTYTPPQTGTFWIRDVEGTLTLTDGSPVIAFADFTVVIPDFDLYKVVTPNGNLRYYRADVLEDPLNTNDFVYIAIYSDGYPVPNSLYVLNVQYFVEAENRMYNIKAPLTNAQLLFFDQLSTPHCMGTDNLSQRLKYSANIYREGIFENRNENEAAYSISSNNTALPASLNPIAENSYDSYTNSDGIIKFYVDDYFGEYYLADNWTLTDDPIVDIIPKELFLISGQHIYVGKEYGFFVNVFDDNHHGNVHDADVMVFDITHVTPVFMVNEKGSTTVEPLFQFRYYVSNADAYVDVDPNLSHLITPHLYYDEAEYFLKDVGFKFSLENPTALNKGEAGYDPYEDNGAFLIGTDISLSGVGVNEHNYSFEDDLIGFALGYVPIVGDILNVASFILGVNNGFGEEGCRETFNEIVKDNFNVSFTRTNLTDQIASDDDRQLTKVLSMVQKPDDDKPRLIHVGGGYVSGSYTVSRKDYSTYNKILVATSVSVSVVEDFEIIDDAYVYYGNSTGTYITSGHKRLDDVSFRGTANIIIPKNTQTNIVKVTPRVSGTYLIRTVSTQGDPHFRITNATAGTSPVVATTDISATNKNAELTIDLVAGNVYYIEALHYGAPYEYTIRIGYAPIATQVLEEDVSLPVTVSGNIYQMLALTPSNTGYYRIYTTCTYGDPELLLFEDTGLLVESDNDSGGNSNAYIEYYMEMGRTYYIAAQGYWGEDSEFTVFATSLL